MRVRRTRVLVLTGASLIHRKYERTLASNPVERVYRAPCTVHRDMCSKALHRASASGLHSALHERIRSGIQGEEERRKKGAHASGVCRGHWSLDERRRPDGRTSVLLDGDQLNFELLGLIDPSVSAHQ